MEKLYKVSDAASRLNLLFEQIPEIVFYLAHDGKFSTMNGNGLKLLGYDQEDILGQPVTKIIKDPEISNIYNFMERRTGERATYRKEAQAMTHDGQLIDVEIWSTGIYSKNGEFVGSQTILRNITDLKKAEDKIKDYILEIEQINKENQDLVSELSTIGDNLIKSSMELSSDLKSHRSQLQLIQMDKLTSLGEMASGVAHNFNNILMKILGEAEDAIEGIESKSAVKKSLDSIVKAAQSGAKIVKRILDYTSARTDDQESINPLPIQNLIEESLEVIEPIWKTLAERQNITYALRKEYKSKGSLKVNRYEMVEVLVNLIKNGLEAMPEGGQLTIRTWVSEGSLMLLVKDEGEGIPYDVGSKVFDPFFSTKGTHGTGLGLPSAYGLVKKNKGKIWFDSETGKGTSFYLTFPLAQGVETSPTTETPDTGDKRAAEERGASILLIDDEAHILRLIQRILVREGYRVDTADSGAKGIEMLAEKQYDAVISDLGMPKISGWAVAEKINSLFEDRPEKRPKIGLFTGFGLGVESEKIQEHQIDFLMSKPISSNELVKTVEKSLASRNREKDA